MTDVSKPIPSIDRWNEVFWQSVDDGCLKIRRCEVCRHRWFPPSQNCPRCLSTDVVWDEVSGEGVIWSRCRFHHVYDKSFADAAPYNVVMIELDEGPMLISNIVNRSWDDIRIGDRVRVVFERASQTVSLVKFQVIDLP